MQSPFFLLDSFSAKDLEKWEKQKEKILRYHWDLYSDLAYQRNKVADRIRNSLLEATVRPFEFKAWQRQVRYKYALIPLSPRGSLYEPGGRFNLPDINPDHISPFPALYMAEDKDTCLQEAGQQTNPQNDLSPLDLALIRKDSISIVAVSGRIDSIIDLYDPQSLNAFLKIIK